MSGERKVKKSGLEFVYYSCTNFKGICKRVYIPEGELLKPVYKLLDQFESITKEKQEELVDELRKNTEAEITFHKEQVNRIRGELDVLKNKEDRLLEAYLDQGITKIVYDNKHREYGEQAEVLEIEMAEHSKGNRDYQTTVARVVSVCRRAKKIFETSSDVAGKRAFLNSLLQNPTVSGKKLDFELRSPFHLVLELASLTRAPRPGLEPGTNRLHRS